MKLHTCLSHLASLGLLLASAGVSAQNLSQSAPSIVLDGMIHPNTSTVALKGTVSAHNAPTQYWLVCGTSPQSMKTATPMASPVLGSSTVTSTVTGLKPNTTYYFQLFASNAAGTTASSIQSFTTGNSEVRAALPEAKAVSANSVRPQGTVQPIKW